MLAGAVDADEAQVAGILHEHHVRDVLDDVVEELLALAQRLLGASLLGDVLVRAQHADDSPVRRPQRQLARPQPALAAVRADLRLLVADLGDAGLHDLAIVGPIAVRGRLPGHVVVGQADQLARIVEAGVVRERRVAAHVHRIRCPSRRRAGGWCRARAGTSPRRGRDPPRRLRGPPGRRLAPPGGGRAPPPRRAAAAAPARRSGGRPAIGGARAGPLFRALLRARSTSHHEVSLWGSFRPIRGIGEGRPILQVRLSSGPRRDGPDGTTATNPAR